MCDAIRVLVVDDQEVVRSGYQLICQSDPLIEIVGEAGSGAEAVRLALHLQPDVIVMDIRMPGMDGVEATEQIVDRFAQPTASAACPRILMLTTFDDEDNVYRSLQAGATSFLLKDAPASDILQTIHHASRGETMLSPAIASLLVKRHVRPPKPPRVADGQEQLSEREIEVMRLISAGLSNAEIGQQLFISERTVKSRITGLLAKLGLRSRVQVVIYAYENGLAPGTSGQHE